MKMNELIISPLMYNWINRKYLEHNKIQEMRVTSLKNEQYRHLVLNEFLNQHKALAILDSLKKCEFIETNDSINGKKKDIILNSDPILKDYRKLLSSNEMIAYMNYLTDKNISKIDVFFGTEYEKSGFLITHNDAETNRKLHFIVFLSTIEPQNGGTLNLYSSNNNQQLTLIKKINPQFNKMVFF